MFRARGTRIILEDIDPPREEPIAEVFTGAGENLEPDPEPEPVVESAAVEPEPYDPELAAALGMPPQFPTLPPDFKARLLAAHAGDLAAIREMRAIGDRVPDHMRMAFAEMVEELLAAE
jgi:hypothetical protein